MVGCVGGNGRFGNCIALTGPPKSPVSTAIVSNWCYRGGGLMLPRALRKNDRELRTPLLLKVGVILAGWP